MHKVTTFQCLIVAAMFDFFARSVFGTPQNSLRAQVTVENWDKGGALSHWVYTHASEVGPSAVVRRGGLIVDLPVQIRPEIGALKVNGPDGAQQTLDQFINNGAVDACIVLHDGKIVYEKYPTMQPNDLHIVMSVGKPSFSPRSRFSRIRVRSTSKNLSRIICRN